MPYVYSIDTESRVVTVTGEGAADFASTAAMVRVLVSDPAFRPEYGILCSVRDLVFVPSLEDARGFGLLFLELRAFFRGRIAVVVQGAARYGVARMISTLVELRGVEMAAFTDPAGARRWLDELPPRTDAPSPESTW